ncbi:MAG: sulfite exporter TauE/SafE family protein [Pseudomonadales bacterium]|jgi:hypothetical protein|nr:sulfite exporter TauE/SafE family protein [Pseudomonadales bacterium]MDP7358765.1 sulfite exporter TauE/SafE family protein [Pseudomonadales bacterium]MDP7597930.1 sulfite exporter TauE/SafE family protein [Pseudomonadales bacterium]HJN50771.1 sulfite exporter TauE/SafE family protein [Pseudomonadales bacterium]|tara:strand:- start:2438 stop:3220 length:783 start_codon:yes stop_codon:yes gene_type:complete
MTIYVLVGGLGLVTGFLSGLLGIGGGIVMAPLLLYLLPVLGFEPLSMRIVAGLTIVQGLVASISGAVSHHRFHFVSFRLSLVMGSAIFVAALAGGMGANYVADEVLLFIFAGLALIAATMLLLPEAGEEQNPSLDLLSFSLSKAIVVALTVGLLGGLVGQGGSFILVPLMIYFVRIPTRIAIGSNLVIVLLSSSAGFIGKAVTGQIEWLLTIPIVLTVIPAARLGSYVSSRTPVVSLRRMLAVLIAAAAGKMWWSLLFDP